MPQNRRRQLTCHCQYCRPLPLFVDAWSQTLEPMEPSAAMKPKSTDLEQNKMVDHWEVKASVSLESRRKIKTDRNGMWGVGRFTSLSKNETTWCTVKHVEIKESLSFRFFGLFSFRNRPAQNMAESAVAPVSAIAVSMFATADTICVGQKALKLSKIKNS